MATEKQRGVLRGMALGFGLTLAVLGGVIVGAPDVLLPRAAGATASALAWDALPLACLAINIGRLAAHRFFTPADIDGGAGSEGTSGARVLQATLQNTLEQVVLAVGTHAIWAATMPRAWQAAVPAAALLFVVGRILFWKGYAQGAAARAVGFALTFYPSVVMLVTMAAHFLYGCIA
jgi:uncharacterized membrane protein YecN with MAPEG domain